MIETISVGQLHTANRLTATERDSTICCGALWISSTLLRSLYAHVSIPDTGDPTRPARSDCHQATLPPGPNSLHALLCLVRSNLSTATRPMDPGPMQQPSTTVSKDASREDIVAYAGYRIYHQESTIQSLTAYVTTLPRPLG